MVNAPAEKKVCLGECWRDEATAPPYTSRWQPNPGPRPPEPGVYHFPLLPRLLPRQDGHMLAPVCSLVRRINFSRGRLGSPSPIFSSRAFPHFAGEKFLMAPYPSRCQLLSPESFPDPLCSRKGHFTPQEAGQGERSRLPVLQPADISPGGLTPKPGPRCACCGTSWGCKSPIGPKGAPTSPVHFPGWCEYRTLLPPRTFPARSLFCCLFTAG